MGLCDWLILQNRDMITLDEYTRALFDPLMKKFWDDYMTLENSGMTYDPRKNCMMILWLYKKLLDDPMILRSFYDLKKGFGMTLWLLQISWNGTFDLYTKFLFICYTKKN